MVAISFREIWVSYLQAFCLVGNLIIARIASAMPLLRVYAIYEWIVKGNLPVFQAFSPVLFI